MRYSKDQMRDGVGMQNLSCNECSVVSGGVGPNSLYTAVGMILGGALFTTLGVLSFIPCLGSGNEPYGLSWESEVGTGMTAVYSSGRTEAVTDIVVKKQEVYANTPICFKHTPIIGLVAFWWGIGAVVGGFCALAGKN